MIWAVLITAGYIAGSMPFGYWLVRLTKGVDIRTVGSGNIGATNVWRTFGRRYGLPVVLLDTAKGFGPALAATLVVDHLAGVLAGAAAMLGHWRPLFLRFAKGGKLVATTGGAFLGVAPAVGGIGAGGAPDGPIGRLIERDFGSVEEWARDLKASGMAGRGWAWTVYDWDEGRLFNYVGDAQNTFPIWNATPLVALDVYEHAYFLDFQTDRGSYIDAFFANLDWAVVNDWVSRYEITV